VNKKAPLRLTVTCLGIYAGLIAIQHGIFESLQGSRAPGGLIFNAIGMPCQPESAWHACFPAMTLIPNLLMTGTAAMVMGVTLVLWAMFFVQRRHGSWILGVLSILLLLVGGGFVPVFIGMVAAIASLGLGRLQPRLAFLAAFWPWPLVLMALWLPGSWLLGTLFPKAMLTGSSALFLGFDILLPVLAALSGLARAER